MPQGITKCSSDSRQWQKCATLLLWHKALSFCCMLLLAPRRMLASQPEQSTPSSMHLDDVMALLQRNHRVPLRRGTGRCGMLRSLAAGCRCLLSWAAGSSPICNLPAACMPMGAVSPLYLKARVHTRRAQVPVNGPLQELTLQLGMLTMH